ncbi:MAG: ATP-binding cassette domain-containing protein [Synergistaceae bacterium]|nr:ATP-binding cassette domain-containing protein [Synergistaceae bacterium]
MLNCVKMSGLCVSFGNREILHSIDAEFPAKKVSVVLGRSGCGKSTLLRSVNRLNECFDGCKVSGNVQILLGGIMSDVSKYPLPELRRRAGMVFQSPNPLPLSVRKNITLPSELAFGLKGRESDELMREVLELSGLWEEVKDRLDAPAASLSGGQQQRLCISRALALRPEVLLLDEPTASLDSSASGKIEEMISAVKENVSVIMVSHSLQQAVRLADYAVVLEDGKVLCDFDGDGLARAVDDGSLIRRAF